jgi:hypothetical protein
MVDCAGCVKAGMPGHGASYLERIDTSRQ